MQQSRNTNLIGALIEHKADLNALNNEGKPPLIIAVETGSIDLVIYLLKEKNLDLSQTNLKGETSLDVAVLNKEIYIILELIYKNTPCNIPQLQLFLETQLKINPLDHSLQMAYSHFKKFYLKEGPRIEPVLSISSQHLQSKIDAKLSPSVPIKTSQLKDNLLSTASSTGFSFLNNFLPESSESSEESSRQLPKNNGS